MKKDILDAKIFDSKIKSDKITGKERWLGYMLGPFSVMMMNSILNSYLNVYYTDVMDIGHIWGGWFLSLFPIVVKILDAFTFVIMGLIVDRFYSRQGKARPWILFSAPLLVISMILLFVVPSSNDWVLVIWIFISYNLFYSIAFTAYNTSHTLMVPLSTKDPAERSNLSVIANSQAMLCGCIVAVLFPTIIVPAMGVNKMAWMTVISAIAIVAFPFILMEYYFTRERVTEETRAKENNLFASAPEKLSLKQQLSLCMQSRSWKVLMIYVILTQVIGCLSNASTFYYCNWVLGSYNDGITQMLYYAVGNAPLGIGIFICGPICKKLGRKRAMQLGYIIATIGTVICALNPHNLVMVLLGQIVKSIGLIPSAYMMTAMLGDTLDDVEEKTGTRCDGFSSSIFNVISTLATGVGLCILNMGLTQIGYIAPSTGETIPVQSDMVQMFFTFCAIGCQTLVYPIIAILLHFFEDDKPGFNKYSNI